MRIRPDILVLGGGGVRGEAWMSGVLAGITASTGIDFMRCEYFVGTSAGAVLAARLAAGVPPSGPPQPTGQQHRASASTELPERPGGEHRQPPGGEQPPSRGSDSADSVEATIWAGLEAATALAGPWVRLGLAITQPAGALARAMVLHALPARGSHQQRPHDPLTATGSEFDGRLRVVAVDRESGRRVVFGSPGSPTATVAEAVTASCAVPTRFAPQRAGGREFVDGGVWSPTNLDVAPAHRGTQVLCLSATASIHGPLSIAIRTASRAATTLELAAARSAGVEVELVTPDRASATAIGPDPLAPDELDAVLAAGYAQGLSL